MLLRWDRAECLQAIHDEHERLGRPIRKYRKVPVDSIVETCKLVIESGSDLHYSPDPEASPEPVGTIAEPFGAPADVARLNVYIYRCVLPE